MNLKNRLATLFLIAVSLVILACDKNIAREEDIAQLSSVSIGDFYVGTDTIVVGDGTTITWSISDDEGMVESITISPDIGQVANSGSKSINPTVSTLYTLDVFVDGEIAKSRRVYVTVLDENGDEIPETPTESVPTSETACSDDTDEDADGATDCEDSDCAADTACGAEVVYAFSSVDVTPGTAVTVGDTVTVAWQSNFEGIRVYVNGDTNHVSYDADNYSISVTPIEASTTTVLLAGLVDGDEIEQYDPITIVATDPVTYDFDAVVSFSVNPYSNLIYGEPYVLEWSVNNANSVSLDGSPDESGRSEKTAGEASSHTLTVVDTHGNEESYKKPISTAQFSSAASFMSSAPSAIVTTATDGEYFLVTSGAVYQSLDYLETATEVVTQGANGLSGSITAFAKSEDGRIYVGTSNGLYYRATIDDAAGFINIGSTIDEDDNDTDVTGIITQGSDKNLVVTTEHIMFAIEPCETWDDGHCLDEKTFEGRTTKEEYLEDEIEFYGAVVNGQDSDNAWLFTSAGVYETTNSGDSFESTTLPDDAESGFWTNGNKGLVWTDSTVYKAEEDDGSLSYEKIEELDNMDSINFAVESGGRYFVATDEGVAATYDNDDLGKGHFWTNLTSATGILVGWKNTTESEKSESDGGTKIDFGNFMASLQIQSVTGLSGLDYQLNAILNDGKKAKLTWKKGSSISLKLGL
jgi:hypothetical protein